MGQGLWGSLPGDLYDLRLRTTDRSANGMPSFSTPQGAVTTEKTHLVFTRSKAGNVRFFVNGGLVTESVVSGDFSTWNPRFPLLLANETTADYPWLGTLYLVAIFDRALNINEVEQNYNAGSSVSSNVFTEHPDLLPASRRFFIAKEQRAGNILDGSSKAVIAFGVQYPDMRCVTCSNNGEQEMTVHANLKSALQAYEVGTKRPFTWVD